MTFDQLIKDFSIPTIQIGTSLVYEGYESIITSYKNELFQIKYVDTGFGEKNIEGSFSKEEILTLIIERYITEWMIKYFREGTQIGSVTVNSIKYDLSKEVVLDCCKTDISLLRKYMLAYFKNNHPEISDFGKLPSLSFEKNNIETIKDVNLILFKRYQSILNDSSIDIENKFLFRAKKMIDVALSEDMFEDKQSRWLGFIQGIMTEYNLLDIEEERNFSRPLFHKAYEKMGLKEPISISL
jgi:hypothetical protein